MELDCKRVCMLHGLVKNIFHKIDFGLGPNLINQFSQARRYA